MTATVDRHRARRRHKKRVIGALAVLLPALLAFVFALASEDTAPRKRDDEQASGLEQGVETPVGMSASDRALPPAIEATSTEPYPTSGTLLAALPSDDEQWPGAHEPEDPWPPRAAWYDTDATGNTTPAGVTPRAQGVGGGQGASGQRGRSGRPSFGDNGGFGGGVGGGLGGAAPPAQRTVAPAAPFVTSRLEGPKDPGLDPQPLFGSNGDWKPGTLPPGFDPCPPGELVVSPCYIPEFDPCPPGGLVVSPCFTPTAFVATSFQGDPGNGGGLRRFGNGGGNGGSNGGGNGGSNGGGNGGAANGGNGGNPCVGQCLAPPPESPPTPVPAPSPLLLLGLGLALTMSARDRRRSR